MATIFRPPVFVRLFARKPKQPENPDNLLPLQTIVVAVQPFAMLDWPNAVRLLPVQKFDAQVNRQPFTILPFSSIDWQNPKRQQLTQKFDVPASLFPLVNPNPAQPFNFSDWLSAKPVRLLPKPDWPINLFPLFRPNPAIPFQQNDWNTLTKRLLTSADIVINLTPLQVVAAVITDNFRGFIANMGRMMK